MARADLHPEPAELQAFALGSLDTDSLLTVESHLAGCTTCQEQVADAAGDTLVELLRRAHNRPAEDDSRQQAVGSRQLGSGHEGPVQQMPTLADAQEAAATPDLLTPTQDETLPPVAPEPVAIPPELAEHPRYRVRRLIGRGGMGDVYEAEHRVMERPVAVKVINRQYTANAAAVERFRREVRAAARLAHPNIVTAHDAEHAGDTLFLVTEYVEGISLGRLVRERGPLPIAEACDYIRQAALGLQHAHERGMVHRDVKPENLMLVQSQQASSGQIWEGEAPAEPAVQARREPRPPKLLHDATASTPGVVKILDFGLAVLTVERGSGLTAEHAIMGTPEYMAPEQAENSHTADIRADIYSLGCTLHVLLTGDVPYPAETPLLKILAHRDRPLPSLRKARHDVPPELTAVLARMMAKKPQDRYQTPAEVATALAPFVGQVANVPPRKASGPLALRRGLLAASLLAALLLAGGVVYRIQTDKGELVITTESDDVEVVVKQGGEFVCIIDTKTDKSITLRSGVYELELKGAPEGLRLNIDKATLTRGKETLAKIERVEKTPPEKVGKFFDGKPGEIKEARRFVGHEVFVQYVAISPDGKLAASGGGGLWDSPNGWVTVPDYAIRLWDLTTSKEIRQFKGHESSVGPLDFSPDGKLLASSGTHEQTIRIWEVATGNEIHCLRGHNAFVQRVAFLPDGRHIVSSGADRLLTLWDVKTGARVREFKGHQGSTHGVAISPDGKTIASASQDKTVRLWDVETGKELQKFDQKSSAAAVAFSPNGRRLLSTEEHGTVIHSWDIKSGNEVGQLRGHTGECHNIAFTPDGRRALSSSWDGTLRLWDVETGKELYRLTGHTSVLLGIAVSSDGRYALAGGNDKAVHMWRLRNPPAAKDKP